MKIKSGDLIYNMIESKTYAVVYVSEKYIVICEQTESKNKLRLFQQPIETLQKHIANKELSIKNLEPVVIDETKFTESGLKTYERNLEIIRAIEKEYGPNYLMLSQKSRKPLINKLMKKYNLSRPALLKIVNKYLQSGCQLASLVETRGTNKPKFHHDQKIRGRKPTSGHRAAKLLDGNDYNNMNESIEMFRQNKSHVASKKDAYITMLETHYTSNIINDDGSISRQLLPIGEYPSLEQYYRFFRANVSQDELDIIKTSAREHRNDKRGLPGTERGELTYPGELCDIDATPVDIYLVSKTDPTQLVNRGHMYFIIDVLTGMILAGNVSFEDNSDAAVTNVLINLKREGRDRLLKETGVTLASDDYWPTDIKPGTLRCDRGSEFVSSEFRRKCRELGITIQLVPAATGSMKGTVEKEFNQFNLANSDFFEHKGLILKRYDSDHKKTACMDISDMLEKENPRCFDDDSKTFIDLYMKSGLYPAEIVRRLFASVEMKRKYPNDRDRLQHIFSKQVYGLAPTEIIYRIAVNFIFGFDVNNEMDRSHFRFFDTLPYAKDGSLAEKLKQLFDKNDIE